MYDLLIVGGGIAGLSAALNAPDDARIAVVDKGEAGAGSSPLAQGGLAAAVGPGDSTDLHARDTMLAGAGICDPGVVGDVCAEGPGVVDWLIRMGCVFDRDASSALDLAREGGQTVARSVHWRDATGAEIVRSLRAAVRERAVERIATRATQLVVAEGRCRGVVADGRVLGARATLLATGGAGGLWGRTTNAVGATGDGIALALAAGAQLADLEFMQFHPTALAVGGAQRVLLTEALRGDGATLIDRAGERFVDELAPRHIVAKAILDAGVAFLDCRKVDSLEERFPTIVAGARAHGLDPVAQPLPVEPAAHYFIGGVAADTHGSTSIPGLYAAGECASTGMHGANRLAGNSLLETVVVGRRVGEAVGKEPDERWSGWIGYSPMGHRTLREVDASIPSLMWEGAGPIREQAALVGALRWLGTLEHSPHRALCTMIVRAAFARPESRGVHVRSDYPETEPALAARSFDRLPPPGPGLPAVGRR